MPQGPRRAKPELPQAGAYRIQTVARRTGVPTAVLRAWERRYGIPRPTRTDSAYRLYSEADVAIVESMRDLRATGLSASEAAALVQREPPGAAPDGHVPAAGTTVRAPETGSVVDRLLAATARLDGREMDRILALLSAMGDPLLAFDEVIRPALIEVGEAWHDGRLTVAHEHLLAEQVSGALRSWIALLRHQEPRARVLVACFADELHGLPAQGFGLRLAAWGYDPVLLGARTPSNALRAAVLELDPGLVALSTTTSGGKASALIAEYAAACSSVPWLVGGADAPRVAASVVAHGGVVAPTAPEDQRALVEALTSRSSSARRSPARRRPRSR